jgi:drug/metabolite transporter (DMT)-like permease
MKIRDAGMLLLLAALWGPSFLFIRIAVPTLGPVALMEFRVLLAAVAPVLYAVTFARLPALRALWKAYLVLGGVNAALPFTLIALAELRLPSSLAAILNATTPLFTAIVAALWLHERLTMKKVMGLIIGVVGVGILVGWGPLSLNPPFFLSVGASLAAAGCYALGGVYSKVTFKGTAPLELVIGQQLGASILLLPFAAFRLPTVFPPLAVWLAVAALALLSTAAGYLLYFYLMARIGPTNTLSVTFLVPVFGLLLGVLFLGESLSLSWLIGLIVILISLVFITGIRIPLPSKLRA